MRRGSISSELLMCGGGVRSILVLLLVARCIETKMFVWHMLAFMPVVVGVCGNVCCLSDVVKDSVFKPWKW